MTLTARIVSAPQTVALPTVAPTVASLAGLRALAGGELVPSAVLTHVRQGGVFAWDANAGTDDGGTRANSGGLGSSSAGWKRVYSGNLLAEWFGATGDGTTDDTAALQLALDAAGAGLTASRKIELSAAGNYRITAGLVLEYTGAGVDTNVALVGGQSSRDIVGTNFTRITWDGNASTTAVTLKSRGCRVEGIAFLVAGGKTCRAAIDIDKGSGGACTHCRVDKCQIFSPTDSFVNGIVVGRSAVENNLEFNEFVDVVIDGCSNAGVSILSETGQSKSNYFHRVAFLNCIYGITTGGSAGSKASFHTQSCSWRDCDYAVYLGGVVDYIALRDSDVEACKRLLYRGASSDCWSVCVDGGRISLNDDVSSDGTHRTWIELHGPGPLIIRNVTLDYAGTTVDPALYKISLDAFNDGYIISEGNCYLSVNPWKDGGGGSSIYAVTQGDNYRTFSGSGPWTPSDWERRKTGIYHLTGAIADATQTLDNFAIVNADVAAAAAIAVAKLAVGAADDVLKSTGATNAFGKIVNANVDAAAAVAVTKLAAGAADTVLKGNGSANAFGKIVNAEVDAAAAIAGTKVSPDFGSQNLVTTGSATADIGNFTTSLIHSGSRVLTAVGTTSTVTTGTPATALSYDPPNNALVIVRLQAFGRADISNYIIAERYARFETYTSSNPTLIGTVQTVGTDDSAGAGTSTPWIITMDASGANIRVRVTGDAGHTIAWVGIATVTLERIDG
jgi:hypothetical protein